jgi:predicted unusual protein kinase regulating ubiquinone biosynthesis (AarF/ABC1/UbiB family)
MIAVNKNSTLVHRSAESAKKLAKILKFSARLQFMSTFQKASYTELGIYTRENLASLGTTFIKIGQLLSTRSDILNREFTEQLAALQDNVPRFDISMYMPYALTILSEIDQEAIASASIGQVHRGVLKTGEVVAVKFKRPFIEDEIQTDFQMLLGFIAFLRSFNDRRELYELETVFKQYETLLKEEINFNKEVNNIAMFKSMFNDADTSKWICVPMPYTSLSTDDVIVMEYLPAIKINDFRRLDEMKFDRSLIAEKLVECYIKQIVEYGTVHIDPHPGNVGITEKGKIVFYDYGMITRINSVLMSKFQDLLLAVSEKDTEAIADIMVQAEIVYIEPENMIYLRSFVLSFLNYIEKVDIAYFKENFIDKINTGDLPFLINSNFLLILRGITILEGICKQLDPDFNYKKVIDPYINSVPVDVQYLERRAIRDIENISKMAFPQMLADNQKNDINIELLELRLKELAKSKAKTDSKQGVSNLILIAIICAVGMGQTSIVDNFLIQLGILGFTFMTVYNKK